MKNCLYDTDLICYFCTKLSMFNIHIENEMVRLGLNGYWGNKGTVSVRFNLYGVSLCVLNSHLAAHDHQNQVVIYRIV